MPLLNPFSGGEAKAKQPINEDLMDKKYKENIEDLAAQIDNLSLGGGGGTVSDASGFFAEPLNGGEDNTPKFWKIRHSVVSSDTDNRHDNYGEDYEGKYHNNRIIRNTGSGIISTQYGSNVNNYKSHVRWVEAGDELRFLIKKGENFFCLEFEGDTSSSEIVNIEVDGVPIDTYGLKDENNNPWALPIDTAQAYRQYGNYYQFYGLDGEEHIITIKNDTALNREFRTSFFDTGYMPKDYTLNHKIDINEGRALVNGSEVSFQAESHTYPEGGEGFCNGYTGYVTVNTDGQLNFDTSHSPAWCEVKHGEAIDFPSLPTELPVKNHYNMPNDGGICLMELPTGEQFFFGYSGKSQTGGPQTQKLTGINWHRAPDREYTPQTDWTGTTTPSVGENSGYDKGGDIRIIFWAKDSIEINSSNNKIDFDITINGVTTLHVATITQGKYAADLVELGDAVRKALYAAKPINGEYICKYNTTSQKWELGVQGPQIEEMNFYFSTGTNAGAAFGSVIGFNTDISGKEKYISSSAFQHLAERVYVADDDILDARHPSIKYSWEGFVVHTEAEKLLEKYGFDSYNSSYLLGTAYNYIEIYPEDNVSGITIYLMSHDIGTQISYKVDHLDKIYITNTGLDPNDADNGIEEGRIIPVFIPLPKGSRKIQIQGEWLWIYEREDASQHITFFGYKNHYTKPKWENFASNERILRTFEVMPPQLYLTHYAFNLGALYIPQISDDQINTITENGTWTATHHPTMFNQYTRLSTNTGDYIDIEFVLQGDGGGFAFQTYTDLNGSFKAEMYLSDTTINEATDLITRHSMEQNYEYDESPFCIKGLKSGTYKIRLKNASYDNIWLNTLQVIDTVQPQANCQVHDDLNNNGQGLAYPIHVLREAPQTWGMKNTPDYLKWTYYKYGEVTSFHYGVNATLEENFHDQVNVMEYRSYWSQFRLTNAGEYFGFDKIAKSITMMCGSFYTNSTTLSARMDGDLAGGLISAQECVKGGAAPSSSVRTSAYRAFTKHYELAITHNTGLTFNMVDTRGLRDGQKVLLIDNLGNSEEAFITNIVFNTSFDIQAPLTVIAAIDVVKVDFGGFHTTRFTMGDAADFWCAGWEYEPMPMQKGILEDKLAEKGYYETKTITFRFVTHGEQIYYPLHSDGTYGNWSTSAIQVIGWGLATSQNSIQFNLDQGLHDILLLYNGSVANGEIDLKITSRKWVKKK